MKPISVYLQYVLPQHFISTMMGKLANCKVIWLKNVMIRIFLSRHPVVMSDAVITDAYAYPTFNEFFIRKLKNELRPIDNNPHAVVSPVDGTIAQIGTIKQQQLIQAKGEHYDLTRLLAHDQSLADYFTDGSFATLYLAPHNYHRVHMPIDGELIKTIFVPGDLFSVNVVTSENVPNLFARNERLICLFNTKAGQMIVIFVGALIVGSIKTVWKEAPYNEREIMTETVFSSPRIAKGAELGYFEMGSTVIVLFAKDKVRWVRENSDSINFGQQLGEHLK